MLVLDGYEDRVKFFNFRHCWVLLERYQKSQSPQNTPIFLEVSGSSISLSHGPSLAILNDVRGYPANSLVTVSQSFQVISYYEVKYDQWQAYSPSEAVWS